MLWKMLKVLVILLIDSAAAKELIVMEMPLPPLWRHQLGLQSGGREGELGKCKSEEEEEEEKEENGEK